MRPLLLMFISIVFLASLGILDTFPTEFSGYSENRMQGDDYTTDTTTEAANTTGVISKMWHKFSNIFKPKTTTTTDFDNNPFTTLQFDEQESKQEMIMPEDRMPPPGREGNSRNMRMIPADFALQEEDKMAQKESYLNRGFYPVHPHQLRMRRSDMDMPLQANGQQIAEVRNKRSTKHDPLFAYTKKQPPISVADKKVPVVHEEFDQGQIESIRPKRFKDIQKSTDWKTEKIVVDSDPVEDIDKTNYIEETKSSDFPFHSFPIKPILVEDSFSFEISTSQERELPPLKIVEY